MCVLYCTHGLVDKQLGEFEFEQIVGAREKVNKIGVLVGTGEDLGEQLAHSIMIDETHREACAVLDQQVDDFLVVFLFRLACCVLLRCAARRFCARLDRGMIVRQDGEFQIDFVVQIEH